MCTSKAQTRIIFTTCVYLLCFLSIFSAAHEPSEIYSYDIPILSHVLPRVSFYVLLTHIQYI